MADLPDIATTATHAFQYVGTDIFGPFTIKLTRFTTAKVWIMLFTCRTFRCVHMEIIWSMDTSSTICAVRRFMARRGVVDLLISDLGTSYVGASNELQLLLSQIDQSKLRDFALAENFEWKFVPAKASHHMGFVERLNRSARRALNGLSVERSYSIEIFETLVCNAEQILNSRPLIAVTSDPNDLDPITLTFMKYKKNSSALPSHAPQRLSSSATNGDIRPRCQEMVQEGREPHQAAVSEIPQGVHPDTATTSEMAEGAQQSERG